VRVLCINGSRSDWGYFKPVLKEIVTRASGEYFLLHTNMAPLDKYGNLSKQCQDEGYPPNYTIYSSYEGDGYSSQSKMVGSLIGSISDVILNNDFDWILLAGDRAEQLAGAVAGMLMHIPIAHIQAGERSGNIDGITRHVIGKIVSLHFASNEDAKERLIRLGENPERIVLTGAPQLDDIFQIKKDIITSKKILRKFNLESKKYIIFVFHTDTENILLNRDHVENTLKTLSKLSYPIIFIMNNNDPGSYGVQTIINSNLRDKDKIFNNLDRLDFLHLLNECKIIIGNSSSGVIEAPVLKVPAINIGKRQSNRVKAQNVIEADGSISSIEKALKTSDSKDFLKTLTKCISPYGSEPASKKIVDALYQYLTYSSKELINRDIFE
jgi:GDP/UDP-N,N'-diacetylbacillosamine 2-epimerase (hydrolysing)